MERLFRECMGTVAVGWPWTWIWCLGYSASSWILLYTSRHWPSSEPWDPCRCTTYCLAVAARLDHGAAGKSQSWAACRDYGVCTLCSTCLNAQITSLQLKGWWVWLGHLINQGDNVGIGCCTIVKLSIYSGLL